MKKIIKLTVLLVVFFLFFVLFVSMFHHHDIDELHNNCPICIFIFTFVAISISSFFSFFFLKIVINLISSQLYQIINFFQINARAPPF